MSIDYSPSGSDDEPAEDGNARFEFGEHRQLGMDDVERGDALFSTVLGWGIVVRKNVDRGFVELLLLNSSQLGEQRREWCAITTCAPPVHPDEVPDYDAARVEQTLEAVLTDTDTGPPDGWQWTAYQGVLDPDPVADALGWLNGGSDA